MQSDLSTAQTRMAENSPQRPTQMKIERMRLRSKGLLNLSSNLTPEIILSQRDPKCGCGTKFGSDSQEGSNTLPSRREWEWKDDHFGYDRRPSKINSWPDRNQRIELSTGFAIHYL